MIWVTGWPKISATRESSPVPGSHRPARNGFMAHTWNRAKPTGASYRRVSGGTVTPQQGIVMSRVPMFSRCSASRPRRPILASRVPADGGLGVPVLKQPSPRSILPGKESCADTRGPSLGVPMRLSVTSGHDAQQVTHDWHDRVFAPLVRSCASLRCSNCGPVFISAKRNLQNPG